MNKEQFQGQWKEIKGKIKETFGKLTDDDLTMINGKRDQLVGALQKRYGIAKERAEENLRNFENQLDANADEDEDVEEIDIVEDEDFKPTRKKTGTDNF